MTNKSFSLSILLLFTASMAIVIVLQREVPAVIRTNLEQIPMQIAGYTATEDFFSDGVKRPFIKRNISLYLLCDSFFYISKYGHKIHCLPVFIQRARG